MPLLSLTLTLYYTAKFKKCFTLSDFFSNFFATSSFLTSCTILYGKTEKMFHFK
jgi:hypothetical protein